MSLSDDIRQRLKEAGSRIERVDTSIGTILMRDISGEMRWFLISIEGSIPPGPDGKKRYPPKVITAIALCDEEGDPLFEEFDQTIKFVGKLNEKVQDELYEHALRVTGLGQRALEDAEKKYSSSQSSESGTSSSSSSEAAP